MSQRDVTLCILGAICIFFLGFYAHYESAKAHPVAVNEVTTAHKMVGQPGVSKEAWLQAAISVAADEENRIGHPMGRSQLAVYKILVEGMYPGPSTPADLRAVMGQAMDLARAARVQSGAVPPDQPVATK